MSSSQQRLQFVDDITRSIVIGFIRLSFVDIPNELINLCILFYAIMECFDKELCNDAITVSDSKYGGIDKVISTKPIASLTPRAAQCAFRIDPAIHSKCSLEWTFKLDIKSHNNDRTNFIKFHLGIIQEMEKDKRIYGGGLFGHRDKHNNYGWHIAYKKNEKKDRIRKQTHATTTRLKSHFLRGKDAVMERGYDNDNTIKVILNVLNKTLRLVINDVDLNELMHENVEIADIFRMGWILQRGGMRVWIHNFKIVDASN